MSPRMRNLLVPFVVLASLTAVAAGAQERPPPPSRPPTLAERLDLKPEQQGAWRAYQAELALEREDASHAGAQADMLNRMTTPQRLDWSLAQLPGREADARRAAAATRAFYEALSPDQRRIFDRLTRVRPPSDGPPPNRTAPPASAGASPAR